jgi:hypothetical protein
MIHIDCQPINVGEVLQTEISTIGFVAFFSSESKLDLILSGFHRYNNNVEYSMIVKGSFPRRHLLTTYSISFNDAGSCLFFGMAWNAHKDSTLR